MLNLVLIFIGLEIFIKLFQVFLNKKYIFSSKVKLLIISVTNVILILLGIFLFKNEYVPYLRLPDYNSLVFILCYVVFLFQFTGLTNFIINILNKKKHKDKLISNFFSFFTKYILEYFIIFIPMQFYYIENDLPIFFFMLFFSTATAFADDYFLEIQNIQTLIFKSLVSLFLYFIITGTYSVISFMIFLLVVYIYDLFYFSKQRGINYDNTNPI